MGSVKKLITAFYIVAIPTMLYFGLKPINNAQEVYARESAIATNSLFIPSISLTAPVQNTFLKGKDIVVPEQIAGAYSKHENKTLIIGHSSTIFKNLSEIYSSDEIFYNDEPYSIVTIETKQKSDIDMQKILAGSDTKTIILMTCAGKQINGHDYTHRLIITAIAE